MQTFLKNSFAPAPFTPARNRLLQRKARDGNSPAAVPPVVHEVLCSPGQPLDPATRAFFEPRFGHDFSEVRVHRDAKAAHSTQAVNALAYTVGRHIVFGPGQYMPTTSEGQCLLAHELAHVVQQSPLHGDRLTRIGRADDVLEYAAEETAVQITERQVQSAVNSYAPELTLQRVSFGDDGPLTPSRKATVQKAANIAERLVMGTGGIPVFRNQWNAFWSGPGAKIEPKPTLERYQTAVRTRVVNDMDTSARADIRSLMASEQGLPLERQTAAVTPVASTQTYLRSFAIDQGIDSVASTLLHESLHGAGLPMGPMMLYEPLFHQFEADVGFPMMMGGADVIDIKQVRRGDTDVDVTIIYNLRKVGNEDVPKDLEIQIVSSESGDVVTDEQPDGSRKPARQKIPSNVGQGQWVWHARNPGVAQTSVRIRDLTSPTLLASRDFVPNPRCVIGVSTMHCEGEK